MMNVLNRIFNSTDNETVDDVSLPCEGHPLVEGTTSTAVSSYNNATQPAGDFISLDDQYEEGVQHQREIGNDNNTDPADNSIGLSDGFTSWSASAHAFKTAIFHTCMYMTLGVLAFTFVFEDWPIIDSLYFSVVLFTTCGYGDLVPDTNASKIFTMAFAVYGIVILGIFLGIVGEKIMADQQDKKKSKIQAARRKYLQNFQQTESSEDVNPDATVDESERIVVGEKSKTILNTAIYIFNKQFVSVVVLTAIAIPVILLEQWDAVKGIYWMVITATSIGLGDETPINPWSKALCILYIPLSIAATGRLLSQIGSAYVDKAQDELEAKFMRRAMTISDLHTMDVNEDGTVSKDEFLIFMLVTLQKVEQDDLDQLVDLFHKLDRTNDGCIGKKDILLGLQRTAKLNDT